MNGQQPTAPWRDRVDTIAPTVLVIGGFMSSPPMYRGLLSLVLHDAEHASAIARHWHGDADHVNAWWPRAVEIWRDALRARVA